MLYSLDRSTPEERLKKVLKEELAAIAARVEAAEDPLPLLLTIPLQKNISNDSHICVSVNCTSI